MQFITPGTTEPQIIRVMVRNEYSTYDVKLVNVQTLEEINYTNVDLNVSEGIAELELVEPLEAKNWYNLFIFKSGVMQNYTMLYCADNIEQQYSHLDDYYTTPTEEVPDYILPKD